MLTPSEITSGKSEWPRPEGPGKAALGPILHILLIILREGRAGEARSIGAEHLVQCRQGNFDPNAQRQRAFSFSWVLFTLLQPGPLRLHSALHTTYRIGAGDGVGGKRPQNALQKAHLHSWRLRCEPRTIALSLLFTVYSPGPPWTEEATNAKWPWCQIVEQPAPQGRTRPVTKEPRGPSDLVTLLWPVTALVQVQRSCVVCKHPQDSTMDHASECRGS